MYCTINDLSNILPDNILIGDRNIGTPVPGGPTGRSNISTDDAKLYIRYAGQYLDGRLRPFYACPLRRTKSYETELLTNVGSGSDVTIAVRDSGAFTPGLALDTSSSTDQVQDSGNMVRIQDKYGYETSWVTEVPNLTTIIVSQVQGNYEVTSGKISVLEYPDPVPLIIARMACSYIIDRFFSAEQSPDVSTYGKTQRNLARAAIEDILNGSILLFGQEHTGRRFLRGSLFDAYKSPAEVTKGEDKE